METNATGTSTADGDHLRLLSIFHYVVAALMAVWGSFPLIHFFMGAAMMAGSIFGKAKDAAPLLLVGGLFMVFAGLWILVGWTMAVCLVVAGRSLARRRRHTFCLVTAGIAAALCMPFGTILGIFTIVVLMRPAVKAAFQEAS